MVLEWRLAGGLGHARVEHVDGLSRLDASNVVFAQARQRGGPVSVAGHLDVRDDHDGLEVARLDERLERVAGRRDVQVRIRERVLDHHEHRGVVVNDQNPFSRHQWNYTPFVPRAPIPDDGPACTT
ncbi:MAG: hypothetical protein UT02_C0030G0002 [Parcubacteria group bacterium GW2011_GWC2_38_7]|nr:MAG: hypothetical protein UT02_C0030G0002 [Parcubacteria group bacterium GW2011_GWC2_38_7]